MTRAVFLPTAEEDMVAAHAAYERRSVGLGDQFAEAVRRQVAGDSKVGKIASEFEECPVSFLLTTSH